MSRHRHLLSSALGILVLSLAVAFAAWRTHSRLFIPAQPHSATHTALSDFRDVLYYPARAALAGVNPYDATVDGNPNRYLNRYPVGNSFPLYSPLVLTLGLPFTPLSLGTGALLWWLVNVALTIVLAHVAWRWGGLSPTVSMTTLLAAAILVSRPGLANVYFGQVTLIVTLACLAALHFAATRPWLGGAALAVATLKPTFGVPLALLMLLRGDRTAAWSGLAIGFAGALAGTALLLAQGEEGTSPLAIVRANQALTDRNPAVDPARSGSRIDAPFVVERIIGPPAAAFSRAALPLFMLTATGLIARSAATRHRAQRRNQPFCAEHATLLLVTVAACMYHNVYDALLLVVPAVVICPWLPGANDGRVSAWRGIAFCLLLVPFVNFGSSQQMGELIAPLLQQAGISDSVRAAAWNGAAVASGTAVTAAWLVLLVRTARQPPAATAIRRREPRAMCLPVKAPVPEMAASKIPASEIEVSR